MTSPTGPTSLPAPAGEDARSLPGVFVSFEGGDGAARLAPALVETATDIHFLVGCGGAAATGVLRERLVRSMAACLEKMGKRVMISWF